VLKSQNEREGNMENTNIKDTNECIYKEGKMCIYYKEKLPWHWVLLMFCIFYVVVFIAFGIGYQYGKKDAYMNNIKSQSLLNEVRFPIF